MHKDHDPLLYYARRQIASTYGDEVSVTRKDKSLLKFGRSDTIGTTKATVMTLPSGILNETYVSSNIITSVSSSNSGDTQSIVVEGHTISGSDLTFSTQTVTLTGQTAVTLPTPIARCNRIYNNGSTDFAGTIYAFQDDTLTNGVPDTAAGVHCMVPSGNNQSLKCATSLSSVDYWIITGFYGDILEKAAAFAELDLEIRFAGKVFRTQCEISAASQGSRGFHKFAPYLVVPPNSDVRLRSIADAANRSVSGGIEGYLAITGGF